MAIRLFKNWWLLGLKGLILFLLGLYTLLNPDTAAGFLPIYLGIAGVLAGISEIILALTNRDKEEWGSFLAEGILDLLIGVIFLSLPEAANIIPILLGIWILFSGASLLMRGLRGKTESNYLIPSLLLLVVGFLMVTNPFGTYVSLMILLGIVLIVVGLALMFVSWKLRGLGHKLEDAAEAVTQRLQN